MVNKLIQTGTMHFRTKYKYKHTPKTVAMLIVTSSSIACPTITKQIRTDTPAPTHTIKNVTQICTITIK